MQPDLPARAAAHPETLSLGGSLREAYGPLQESSTAAYPARPPNSQRHDSLPVPGSQQQWSRTSGRFAAAFGCGPRPRAWKKPWTSLRLCLWKHEPTPRAGQALQGSSRPCCLWPRPYLGRKAESCSLSHRHGPGRESTVPVNRRQASFQRVHGA